ncbi:MAG: hypothetical protein WCS87_02995 [Methylococcaceae bacterium]
MSIKNRLLKLENLAPKSAKFKPMPLACWYGEMIPESEWPEYETIPTLSDFYREHEKL